MPNTISLRRRQVVIAGLAAAATPGALFAAQCVPTEASGLPTFEEILTKGAEGELIISGRVVGSDCKPVSSAVVEVWYSNPKDAWSTTTDADGRFMVTTVAPPGADSRAFKISVSLPDGRTLTVQRRFTREDGLADETLARLHRDDSGVWRTTLGLSFV